MIKKTIILICIAIIKCSVCFSGNINKSQRIIKENDVLYIVENEGKFLVDKTVVTIKPISRDFSIPDDVKVLNSNFPFSLQHSFGKGEVILDFQNEGNLTISGTTQQYCSWPKGGYQYSTGYQNGKALILSISSEEYSDVFFLRINGNILDIQEISESEYCIFRFHRLKP